MRPAASHTAVALTAPAALQAAGAHDGLALPLVHGAEAALMSERRWPNRWLTDVEGAAAAGCLDAVVHALRRSFARIAFEHCAALRGPAMRLPERLVWRHCFPLACFWLGHSRSQRDLPPLLGIWAAGVTVCATFGG